MKLWIYRYIEDDTNKINDTEKRTEETKLGISKKCIVKYIQGWEITKIFGNKHKIYVTQFSAYKVSCMKDYLKLSIRENNPDHIIFHVGTNDVPIQKTSQVIAQSMVDLAKSVANDNLQVNVSSIVQRNDQWNEKVHCAKNEVFH